MFWDGFIGCSVVVFMAARVVDISVCMSMCDSMHVLFCAHTIQLFWTDMRRFWHVIGYELLWVDCRINLEQVEQSFYC